MFSLTKNKHSIALILVLLFSFFLRVYKLAETPSGFHADEASFYINAKAIAQTGKDEDGRLLPLSLNSLIDPKPALYSYLQIPLLFIFNNQIFAARFLSSLLAVLSLFMVYLFMKEISQKKIALITTTVLAISPWHLVVSRGTQEVIASFVFLVASLYILVLILKNTNYFKATYLVVFFLTSFFSMYFYHSAKVILPLMVLSLLVLNTKKIKNILTSNLSLVLITVFAFILSLVAQQSSKRLAAVNIFADSGPQQKLMEQIFTTRNEVPLKIIRIFYNKAQTYFFALASEYSKYFSPDFLFFSGEKPTRYIVPDHGLFYLIEIPLIVMGIFLSIRSKRKELPIIMALLFLSPIPASLTTQETPSLLRSFPMVLAFGYFIAIGINYLITFKKILINQVIISIICLSYIWSLFYFGLQYHVQAKYTKPYYRNSPYTQIAKSVKKLAPNYESIEVTNNLLPLYSYFVMEDLISIHELQDNPEFRNQENYTLGKFKFNKNVCAFTEIRPKVLYIAESGCIEKNEDFEKLFIVETITYNDGLDVYELLQATK